MINKFVERLFVKYAMDISDSAMVSTITGILFLEFATRWQHRLDRKLSDGLLRLEGSGRSSVAQMRVNDRTCNMSELLVPLAAPY